MKTAIRYFSFLVIVLLCLNLVNEKPKILIIGDSISIGYTPFVKEVMEEKAHVVHNPGNAEHSGTGLVKVEEWIGDEKWDVIQFNWGLWDLCYRHPDAEVYGNRDKVNGQITFSVEDYAANLDSIVRLIKSKTKAKLVFVTTTYVPDGEAGRFRSDAIQYNKAALLVMEKHAVKVLDVYEASIAVHDKYSKAAGDVHYTDEGYEKLGKLISGFLMEEI